MTAKVIVLTGPTATGKTALGVALAGQLDGEVISADSMQIYKRMDIGTAKPAPEETHGIPHHMIDVAEPEEDYSVSRYAKEASLCIDDIIARGKTPIIVGGTGLYIDALLRGADFAPKGSEVLRDKLGREYDELGEDAFRARLSSVDPQSEARINRNDKKRLIRAMEVYLLSGVTISEFDRRSRSVPPKYESLRIALTFSDREALYRRIDRRVDIMVESGLRQEVERLLDSGISPQRTAMQAIGYKEYVRAISGLCSEEEAIEDIKRESRRYAKRQLSWLRRDDGIHWIEWKNAPDLTYGVAVSTEFARQYGI